MTERMVYKPAKPDAGNLRIARLEQALKELATYADAEWVRLRAKRALKQVKPVKP